MRFFIELSYNGKEYHGWQNQPNAVSVQSTLEHALSTLLKTNIDIVGAGRTDAGVHALQMFAHFDFEGDFEAPDLVYKLNSFLPKDIAVQNIHKVRAEAHARFDAEERTYIYRISRRKDAFNFENAFCLKHDLDLDLVQEASAVLKQYQNFKCFSRSNTDVKTYNCNIKNVDWRSEDHEFVLTITADRFLRNMVRAIVGTLIDVGLKKVTIADFHNIIKSQERSNAGASAPAHGLYLSKIKYPETVFNHE